jgi:hypothetical protein
MLDELKCFLKQGIFEVEQGSFKFKETQQQNKSESPLKEIIISDVDANVILSLKPTSLNKLNDVCFQGIGKNCDFILLRFVDAKALVYLVECKSTLTEQEKNKALNQIKHSSYPVEYLFSVFGKEKYSIDFELKGLICYTVFKTGLERVEKQSVGLSPSVFDAKDHNQGGRFPIRAKKVASPTSTHTLDQFLGYFETL